MHLKFTESARVRGNAICDGRTEFVAAVLTAVYGFW